jgi:hypothetical protein
MVDSGDPQETRRIKELLGFVEGQMINLSLIAKNPHIRELIASRQKPYKSGRNGRTPENRADNFSSLAPEQAIRGWSGSRTRQDCFQCRGLPHDSAPGLTS